MSPIQFILIPLLVIIALIYFGRLRSGLLDFIIVLLLGTTGVVMVIVPEWTTLLARSLGVGRGADLINYLGWIGIAFVCIGLYSKLRVLESHLTELTRVQAIEHAHAPGKGDEAMGSEGGGARDY